MRLNERDFQKLVDKAMESLPPSFVPYLENVIVEVQDRPTREVLRAAELKPGYLLMGFYQGVPLTEKSVSAPFEYPERILVFQRNIEAVCDTHEEIVDEVRKTVLHEIGHHFGMDEDDLGDVGYG